MSSSIHIGKVSSGSFLHNDRTQKVSYLIDDSSLNECSRSSSDCLIKFQSLKLQAIENYTKLTNQKMQKSTIFLKEAIVNLQEHHTLKDLEPIKKRLESYGFKVLQMSIHRDEGFINPDNKKEKNYHAHITMFNLDLETGKSVKFGKNYRNELSKLQTFVANTLQMERGKVSVKEHAEELKVTVQKPSKRLDTHEYKKAMKIKEEAQHQLTISQKQGLLKDIVIVKSGYDFREMQQKITSLETLSSEQKKELHKLNSQVKNTQELDSKNSKIQELESKIQELTEHKKALVSAVTEGLRPEQVQELKQLEPMPAFKKSKEFVKENILGFKNQAIDAQKTNEELKTTIDTLKSDLSVLKQDMSVLQASNDELTLTIGKKDRTIQNNRENKEYIEKCFEKYGFSRDNSVNWYSRTINFIKSLGDKISSLTKENQELKAKVKELESPKTIVKNSKDEFYERMEAAQKIIRETISDKPYVLTSLTREELRKDDQEAQERLRKKQSQGLVL